MVAQNTINLYPQTGIGQVMVIYLKQDVCSYNFAKNGRRAKSFIEGVK